MKINRAELLRHYRRDPRATRYWAVGTGTVAAAAIAARAPIDTGAMRSSIRYRRVTDAKGPVVRIEARPKYALYQEVGTGIYGPARRYITPKRARALSWVRNGKRHYAAKVRGVRPQRYFREGLHRTFGRSTVRYYGASRPR